MASLAGCTNVIVHKICKDRGFTLLDMEIDVTGVLDPRGIFGREKVKVPFPEVRLTVRGKTRNTPEDMAILREELAWRCPVSVVIRESGSQVKETWEIEYLWPWTDGPFWTSVERKCFKRIGERPIGGKS